jgi:hypothetical protein
MEIRKEGSRMRAERDLAEAIVNSGLQPLSGYGHL